jgi:hypothetical protein
MKFEMQNWMLQVLKKEQISDFAMVEAQDPYNMGLGCG